MEEKLHIAIDGPAAAGKSTVAKKIADLLDYIYIDSGAMYRALTYKAIEAQYPLTHGAKLSQLLMNTDIELVTHPTGQRVLLDRKDVTREIRSQEVTRVVSLVAEHHEVREIMVQRQQKLALQGGVIMDGRDIGTRVMPYAEVKIFLLASVEERAKRRFQENQEKGITSSLKELEQEITLRDQRDSEREASPLIKAEDAIEIDTTSLSIDEVVSKIMSIIKERA